MSISEQRSWPGELAELYDAPPDPGACRMFSVHVDERDASVTLGFETGLLPARPRPEWAGTAYNTFVFSMVFRAVADLRVRGILADAEREMSLEPGPEGRLEVSVTGSSRSVTFTAGDCGVAGVGVRLQGAV
ncbi:Imm50 family immunity protein [Streptomyces sp. NPDC048603]|uniref:Imm50 family immunity protein n=1 Tax=Streptomyces sp. NPDC048603 TaxID=3365577 RepID=UPI00371D46AE